MVSIDCGGKLMQIITLKEGYCFNELSVIFVSLEFVEENAIHSILTETFGIIIKYDHILEISIEIFEIFEVFSIINHRFLSKTSHKSRLIRVEILSNFLHKLILIV